MIVWNLDVIQWQKMVILLAKSKNYFLSFINHYLENVACPRTCNSASNEFCKFKLELKRFEY